MNFWVMRKNYSMTGQERLFQVGFSNDKPLNLNTHIASVNSVVYSVVKGSS